jgi:hypothetical protein
MKKRILAMLLAVLLPLMAVGPAFAEVKHHDRL